MDGLRRPRPVRHGADNLRGALWRRRVHVRQERLTGGGAVAAIIRRAVAAGTMSTTAACQRCGRHFTPHRPGVQINCTPCKNWAAKEAIKTLHIKCKECRKPFTTASRAVRYCSEPCRTRRRRRSNDSQKRSYHTRTSTVKCRICGKSFKTGRGHGTRRVFCSDECRAAGRKILNRECQRKYLADPERRAIHRERTYAAAARRRAREKEADRSRPTRETSAGRTFQKRP